MEIEDLTKLHLKINVNRSLNFMAKHQLANAASVFASEATGQVGPKHVQVRNLGIISGSSPLASCKIMKSMKA